MSSRVLASEALCRPGPLHPGWVAIHDDVITEVGDGAAPAGATDIGAAVLAPAFLDLQLNGVDGVDLATADDPGWAHVGDHLARHGVAAYLATFVSAPLDAYDPALARLAAARTGSTAGAAAALGAHLEGPFLGDAPGAHPVELLRAVDLDWLSARLAHHPGLVKMVTLAPEADPGLAATAWLAARGVVVALGHSRATDETARAAADAGARAVTHTFNGMAPLHHRAPGLAGAALDDERLTPTLIADLVHVHPTVARIVLAAKATTVVVSDAVAVVGPLRAADGAARLADGTLAGATTLLDQAVANLVGVGVPIERAVAAVSAAPAALLGLPDRGRLIPGARADLVALDRDGRLLDCWIGGEPAH